MKAIAKIVLSASGILLSQFSPIYSQATDSSEICNAVNKKYIIDKVFEDINENDKLNYSFGWNSWDEKIGSDLTFPSHGEVDLLNFEGVRFDTMVWHAEDMDGDGIDEIIVLTWLLQGVRGRYRLAFDLVAYCSPVGSIDSAAASINRQPCALVVFAGSRVVTFRAVENQFIRQSDERGRSVPVAFVPLAIGGTHYIAVIERNFERDPEKNFRIALWRFGESGFEEDARCTSDIME